MEVACKRVHGALYLELTPSLPNLFESESEQEWRLLGVLPSSYRDESFTTAPVGVSARELLEWKNKVYYVKVISWVLELS